MRAHAASGATTAHVSPLAFDRVADQVFGGRIESGSTAQRGVYFIGRLFSGLSPSGWLALDLTVLLSAIALGYWTFPPPELETTPHIALWQAWAVFATCLTVTSLVFGLNERETLLSGTRVLARTLLTLAAATVLAYAIVHVLMYSTLSRRVAGLGLGTAFLVSVAIRLGAGRAIRTVPRRLLVVGSRALFESFQNAQTDGLLGEYRLLGYTTTPSLPPGEPRDTAYLGPMDEVLTDPAALRITDIVVGAQAARDPQLMDWIVRCLQQGCRVTNEAIFYEKAAGQILVDEITPAWFLFADLKVHCDRHTAIKRAFDLAASVVLLCLTAPLWPVIALAVKLCDGGPVFYSQERIGQHGRVFRLHKFRTMRPDAENGKSIWATPDDPRATRVGRLLRRTRLDELPQLLNVLVGRMSIVGPRPERPDIVAELTDKLPYYAERHLVKPGITGWAQISFRYGASIADAKRKLQFDLYYLKHMSFETDLTILLRTAGTFLRGAC